MRYVVSACLAGIDCRYNGGNASHPVVRELVRSGQALPVCPEVLGGLSVPRPPCELMDGSARTPDGRDCDTAYRNGAAEALRLARAQGCTHAVLKARSPSCGVGRIYDGTFSHIQISGDGVFAALLRAEGFQLQTEEELTGDSASVMSCLSSAQRDGEEAPQ